MPDAAALVDRYTIGDLIGRGGMADVFAGFDQRLQRDVAIKITRDDIESDDVGARFESEAQVAARLHHPNVVAVYDTGTTDDGRPFIVMERLPGETLGDRIRSGPLPESAVRSIAADVVAALSAAHTAGVVHRDIKPGNILLAEDGRAKIADFGIARESDTLSIEPTTLNAATGTPSYLAPERMEGKPATPRSDVWALGVVLYEALTGRKPMGAPPLTDAAPGVDPVMASVVERAMAYEPDDRYESASSMAAALRGAGDTDTDATAVDAVDRTMVVSAPAAQTAAGWPLWRRMQSNAAMWLVAAGLFVLLLIGIGIAVGRDANTTGHPAPAAQTTTAPTATVTTTPTTTITAAVPVQNAPAPVVQVRRGGKGRKGKG